MTEPLTTYLPHGARFSNPIAEGTHWVGNTLMMPALETVDLVFKLIEPLQPGYHRQWSNTALEVTRRALIVFALLLLLPLNLALTPFGIGLSALANLARRDFIFIYPEQTQAPEELRNGRLNITTFNVAFMPEFITTHNKLRSTAERTPVAADALATIDDDIICLQEAFDERAVLKVAQRLGDAYPYKVMLVAHQTLGLSSGLCMFSKFPLENVTFWQHQARGGVELYANKGLLGATVRLPGNRIAYMFNTHLCGPVPDSWTIAKTQMEEIRGHIQAYIRAHPPENGEEIAGTFFAGDFNDNCPEYYFRYNEVDHCVREGSSDRSGYYLTQNAKSSFQNCDTRNTAYDPSGALDDTESHGTFFGTEDPVTRWDTARIREWKIRWTPYDHILYISDTPVQATHLRHHMNGSSDHLALRASFQFA